MKEERMMQLREINRNEEYSVEVKIEITRQSNFEKKHASINVRVLKAYLNQHTLLFSQHRYFCR